MSYGRKGRCPSRRGSTMHSLPSSLEQDPIFSPLCVSSPAEHHMSQEYSFYLYIFFKVSGNKRANPDLVTGQLKRIGKKKNHTSPGQGAAGRKQPAVATASLLFTPWCFQNSAPPPQLKKELMLIKQVSHSSENSQCLVRQVHSMKSNTV